MRNACKLLKHSLSRVVWLESFDGWQIHKLIVRVKSTGALLVSTDNGSCSYKVKRNSTIQFTYSFIQQVLIEHQCVPSTEYSALNNEQNGMASSKSVWFSERYWQSYVSRQLHTIAKGCDLGRSPWPPAPTLTYQTSRLVNGPDINVFLIIGGGGWFQIKESVFCYLLLFVFGREFFF